MSATPPVAVVLRALGLGDLLVAVPALRLIRRALPGHRLVLAAPGGLTPLVDRIDAVDALLPCPEPAALQVEGPVDVAVNLHGRGPQSHAALDALAPRWRIGHAAPGWNGPAWSDDGSRAERRRWCDLLAATGLVTWDDAVAGADDLHLDVSGAASLTSSVRNSARSIASLPAAAPPAASLPAASLPAAAPSAAAPPAASPRSHGVDPRRLAVVHPGAAYGSKRWPADRFAAVAASLAARSHRVVVTGGADERDLTAAVVRDAGLDPTADLGGATDLAGLLDLVAGAGLVVAGDTGISHVATAFAVPSVTLFGPVGPEQWGPPPGGPHVVLTDATFRRGERFADDPDPALLAVTSADVLDACARLVPA